MPEDIDQKFIVQVNRCLNTNDQELCQIALLQLNKEKAKRRVISDYRCQTFFLALESELIMRVKNLPRSKSANRTIKNFKIKCKFN